MDLDSYVVWEVETPKGSQEIEEINVAESSRELKSVLNRDSIIWSSIDGLRSLMIAWKKLVTTSSRFCEQSQDFLQKRSPQAPFTRWNARAEAEDEEEELEDDWEKLETIENHGAG